jgi:predicted membrane GTPase involved in stress response
MLIWWEVERIMNMVDGVLLVVVAMKVRCHKLDLYLKKD